MPNIALRSPQYKMIEVPASGVQSTKCTISIDGTVRYIIVRNITTWTKCNYWNIWFFSNDSRYWL